MSIISWLNVHFVHKSNLVNVSFLTDYVDLQNYSEAFTARVRNTSSSNFNETFSGIDENFIQ